MMLSKHSLSTSRFRCFGILAAALIVCSVQGKTEASETGLTWRQVRFQGFDEDIDGNGIGDGWFASRPGQQRDRLDKEDKTEGASSQVCDAAIQHGGVWSPAIEVTPGRLYRLSFWIKVSRGVVMVRGQGRLVYLGYSNQADVYDTSNAGEWRHVVRMCRATPWHTSPPGHTEKIWACATWESKQGAEFRLDAVKLEEAVNDPNEIAPSVDPKTIPTGPVPPEKRLIACGNDAPLVRFARHYIEQMERAPFDGTVMHMTRTSSVDFFSDRKIPEADALSAIEDLKATDFNRFKHNFFWAHAIVSLSKDHPDYHGDWFDDENWEAKLHNARLYGKVARAGGLKGIMFDTEMYCGQVFSYLDQKDHETHDFETYRKKVCERGRQWIQAINNEYPDIEIIFMFAPSSLYLQIGDDPMWKLEESHYALLPTFMDGIMDAATPQTKLIDGFEDAYNIATAEDFAVAPQIIKKGGASLAADPEGYARRMQAAFGIAVVFNYPKVIENALYHALQNTDQYVWVWYGCGWAQTATPTDPLRGHFYLNWWVGNVPRTRAAAVFNARKAREHSARAPGDGLSPYWTKKDSDYYTIDLKQESWVELDHEVAVVDSDEDPKIGTGVFKPAGDIFGFDQPQRSVVLDLGRSKAIEAVRLIANVSHLTTARNPLILGAYRLDPEDISLYLSNDNTSYMPITDFVYRELNPFVVEISDIASEARYLKIHVDLSPRERDTEAGFPVRQEIGGVRVFGR